jgi:peptidyl-prolyl cis-trans isomerase D
MYGPVFNNDVYTLARLGETRMIPDSLGARHILLPADSVQLADSLVGAIRRGGNFAALATQYSVDPSAAQNGGDLGRFAPETMIPEFSDALMKQKAGDVFTVTSPVGIHVVELTHISPLVEKAQIAMIEYNVDPSSVTEMGVYNDARSFYQAAYGSADNFGKAVSDGQLQKRTDRVIGSQRNITGLGDARELVRWAFNAKVGDVSTEMKIDNNQYVVAVLTGATEDGIAPFERYQNDIRTVVIRQKKGEMLAAKAVGSTIEEVAAAVGKPVVEGEGINFLQMNVEGITPELKLMGAITSGIEAGKLSKPVIGNFGVYSFVITGKTEDPNVQPAGEKAIMEATSEMYLDQRMTSAMRENADIVDSRVKYF